MTLEKHHSKLFTSIYFLKEVNFTSLMHSDIVDRTLVLGELTWVFPAGRTWTKELPERTERKQQKPKTVQRREARHTDGRDERAEARG